MKVFCEYLENPMGIDNSHPRFSWIVNTTASKQKAYQIIVKHSVANDLVWDSGVIQSDQTVNIPYMGEELKTAQTYLYKIKCWTDKETTEESDWNSFTMGIMDSPVWTAPWIGGPWMEVQSFWFRTSFEIQKPFVSAYVYVLSPNYYVLTVNGNRCGTEVLQNAPTDPDKTLLYSVYSACDHLLYGENVIGIELGNGWHALNLGITDVGLGEHLFSLQMRIEYEDGSFEWITSNPDQWIYTKEGPVKNNSIYHGETYDSRCIVDRWDKPGFDIKNSNTEWFDAVEFEPPTGIVHAQMMEPIRVVKEIKPIQIYKNADNSYTFDMGQNFAGWAKLSVSGEKGTCIKLIYSELIHKDHTVNQISLRDMRATDTYILCGNGIEVYEPRFTYHGFRYVQVVGLTKEPDETTITGCVVRSAVDKIGNFTCDHSLLNQLQKNICWTEESNLHGVPTDCPQRNERLGWTNDMTVRNECALYNYKLPSLYTKWINDIRDTQGAVTGAISDTAPFRVYGSHPGDPVGASFILVPWNLYLHYQDIQILENNYDSMRRYVEYLKRNSSNYIMRWATMGDWAAPIGDNDVHSIGGGAVSLVTPPRLMATAFFYYNCILMSKIACALNKHQDSAYYQKLSISIKEAFLKEYYHFDEKYVGSNSQGCNTIALYMNLVPDEDRKKVLKHLVKDIVEKNNYHLTTGNLCSRYVIEVLLTNGYEDVAFRLLTQTTYPSWGYMIEKGATTIWERWEEITEECSQSIMASYNHPMYGAVGVCFYKYFAGIQLKEQAPGFQEIIIHPIIPTGLKHVRAEVNTIRGKVLSEWQCFDDMLLMNIEIPFNTSAEIHIPKTENNTIFLNNEVISKDQPDSYIHYTENESSIIFRLTSGKYKIKRI